MVPTDVYVAAEFWVRGGTDRYYLSILPTGSMQPYFNEHSLVLCVKYTNQTLSPGAVLHFDRGDTPSVLHVMTDQTTTHVFMSGSHNSRADGWFPKTAIKGFVVGQLYLP